ncbi:DUF6702 family protein [Flavobacterium sp. XGLA_31]|uniref:DUF6702 family protein n=1 Tax=Flavobacterium sp. XGLA_31 TaxID=3447666 RepID=UPI003F362FB0
MKRRLTIVTLVFLLIGLSAFSLHRFYAAIYQINFVPQKKTVQITTRIFIDDLNEALKRQYHKTTFVGTNKETPEDIALMKKYLSEKFKIAINGQPKTMNYLSAELENNVIICYLNIKEISKIASLEVANSVLTEVYPDQQNIIQYTNDGKKQNLLLTGETTKGMLK